jgi:hypothetical protein
VVSGISLHRPLSTNPTKVEGMNEALNYIASMHMHELMTVSDVVCCAYDHISAAVDCLSSGLSHCASLACSPDGAVGCALHAQDPLDLGAISESAEAYEDEDIYDRISEIEDAIQTTGWVVLKTAGWVAIRLVCSSPLSIKIGLAAYAIWRATEYIRWQEPCTVFDGADRIAFCTHCSPEILDDETMQLGNDYEKRFHVPNACPRCSYFWPWRGSSKVRIRISSYEYQYMGTYCGLRLQKPRDVHGPAVNQLDTPNTYGFANRFLQMHGGTLGELEHKTAWTYSSHTQSYCYASQWHGVDDEEWWNNYYAEAGEDGGQQDEADQPADNPDGGREMTFMQRMRQYWQFTEENDNQLPQSTLIGCAFRQVRNLFSRLPILDVTEEFRLAETECPTRVQDTAYMSPPPGQKMVPVAKDTAKAVGPITHMVTVHNAQDRYSVFGALDARSKVKNSVFPDADGNFQPLSFKKNSPAANRLNVYWKDFNRHCVTDDLIDKAYHKHFAGKTYEEIVMSKFTQEEVAQIREQLQTYCRPEEIRTREGNGKQEGVNKDESPGRVVYNNHLELLAITIISGTIYQHILFDEEDGIYYNMSIKHRPRDEVLDDFGDMMTNPFAQARTLGTREAKKAAMAAGLPKDQRAPGTCDIETCCWEIDQSRMELHERVNRYGEGILGYSYNVLMRIDERVRSKINGEFTKLHQAKLIYDVRTGLRVKFKVRSPHTGKDAWYTSKFPDVFMDSGWMLTAGVNAHNELSGTYCSVVKNPQHLFAKNPKTGKFRIQDGTFDWKFKSVDLYQTPEAKQPSSFDIYFRGLVEGDDGGGAASRCLADPRNGGDRGLIIRQQEDLGYSAKLKTMVDGRLEIIGAHFPVENGLVSKKVPWIPAVTRYTAKLGMQTNVNITPSSTCARFMSLSSMFSGRCERLERAFAESAQRIIEQHSSDKKFWTRSIRTDGYTEIDRACGTGVNTLWTLQKVKDQLNAKGNKIHQTSEVEIMMLNMSIAENVAANYVTRNDHSKLSLFADECRKFDGDNESAYSLLPVSFR